MSELELQGKTALVTGASKGIGKASALKLASMGANIAVNYFSSENEALDTVKEVKSLGVDAFAVQANVGKLDEVDSMISAIKKNLKKLIFR